MQLKMNSKDKIKAYDDRRGYNISICTTAAFKGMRHSEKTKMGIANKLEGNK